MILLYQEDSVLYVQYLNVLQDDLLLKNFSLLADILLMNLKGTCSPRIVYKGTRGNCSQPFRIRFPNFSLCIKTPAAVVLNHLGFDFLVSVCFNFSSKFKLNRNAKWKNWVCMWNGRNDQVLKTVENFQRIQYEMKFFLKFYLKSLDSCLRIRFLFILVCFFNYYSWQRNVNQTMPINKKKC